MRRRALLAAVGTGCVALGGCLGNDTGDTDGGPDPTGTFDPRGDIALVVRNHRDAASTVTVTVTADGTTVFEDTVKLDADESTTLDPGLDVTEDGYELLVETEDGSAETFPFTVEDFDIQHGSNIEVDVLPDRLRMAMQE